jgi:hypothetical protein
MNAAGYRYAASDQAFYLPAVIRHLDPALFPRDAALIDSQARLTVVDDVMAGAARVTGLSLQHLFLVFYIATLVLMAGAAARIGGRLYRSGWTAAALVAALTLRHAIAKTGANTLEGYFHPRQLAFALGLWAIALFLEHRDRLAILFVAGAAALHPTTAGWFAIWLGTAMFLGRPAWRRPMLLAGVIGAVLVVALVWRGTLSPRLVRMDAEWLSAVGDKDLFPLRWPLDVWLTNLISVPIILLCWRSRMRAGRTVAGETPLVIGALTLLAFFVVWLPFNAAQIALAVELQAARVFWPLDVFATVYLVWWLAESTMTRRPMIVAAAIAALSLVRGTYTCFVQFPDRQLFAVDIQHADWRDAMAFAAASEPGSGWLADPIHAAKYGSSVRAAGRRDVLIEELKDRAIAMYDRNIALRINERERALSVLAWDTPDGAHALARRFGLDYLVIDRELALPLIHRSGSLYIYRLR